MKKLISLLFLLLIPVFVFAADDIKPLECCRLKSDVKSGDYDFSEGEVVGSPGGDCDLLEVGEEMSKTKEWGLICLLGTVGTITNWIFIALMVVSPTMVLLGAYYIMTAGAEPERVDEGRNFIVWAAVGLIIALFSNAIPGIISSLII